MRVTSLSPSSCRRVLLVTANPHLREHLSHAIREMAFDVTWIGSPGALDRAFRERPHEIAVVDARLPGGVEPVFDVLQGAHPDVAVVELGAPVRQRFHQPGPAECGWRERLPESCSMRDLELALDRARRRRQTSIPVRSLDDDEECSPMRDEAVSTVTTAPKQTVESGAWLSLEEMERKHILATLERCHGNRALTATALGISLRKLYYRLGQYQRDGLLQRA